MGLTPTLVLTLLCRLRCVSFEVRVDAASSSGLCSSHRHAVYGSSHVFIDPNIWYDEQEMSKQVEQSICWQI